MTTGIEDRFWSNVADNAAGTCWEWTGWRDTGGYGCIYVQGKTTGAHRVSFWLKHGRWPEPCCLHTCDNRACVNPEHLREGTQADNIHDAVRKQRHAHGEQASYAKLTEREVQIIRLLCGRIGLTQREVARRYHVSQSQINHITTSKRWTHVEEPAW